MSTFFAVVSSLVFFVGGIWLFGVAFHATGYEALVFVAGVIAVAVGVFIPTTIVGRHSNTWKA